MAEKTRILGFCDNCAPSPYIRSSELKSLLTGVEFSVEDFNCDWDSCDNCNRFLSGSDKIVARVEAHIDILQEAVCDCGDHCKHFNGGNYHFSLLKVNKVLTDTFFHDYLDLEAPDTFKVSGINLAVPQEKIDRWMIEEELSTEHIKWAVRGWEIEPHHPDRRIKIKVAREFAGVIQYIGWQIPGTLEVIFVQWDGDWYSP